MTQTARISRLLCVVTALAAQSVFAADVSFYGVVKGQDFTQDSDDAPTLITGTPYFFQCFVDASGPDLITGASVQLPSGSSRVLQPDGSDSYSYEEQFSSLGNLNSTYGTGTYSLTVESENDLISFAQLAMPADAYPNTPQITNYTAAQAIDPDVDFTLSWQGFTGGTVDDFVLLEIRTGSDNTVFETGEPGGAGSLNGTSSSVLIPANTLSAGETYEGRLMFAKIVFSDTTSISGAQGVLAFLKETRFSLKTTGTIPTPSLQVLGFSAGHFQFKFDSVPGRNYQIQWADTLPNWQNLWFTNATSSEIVFTDPFSVNTNRFYRVERLP